MRACTGTQAGQDAEIHLDAGDALEQPPYRHDPPVMYPYLLGVFPLVPPYPLGILPLVPKPLVGCLALLTQPAVGVGALLRCPGPLSGESPLGLLAILGMGLFVAAAVCLGAP